MAESTFQQKFLRSLGRNTFYILRWITSRLPYPIFKMFSSFFIALARPLLVRKKRLAMENLHTAFGQEKTAEEIKEIADQCFNTFAWGMIELIYLIDRPKKIVENVTFEGKEHLDQALAAGKGAVLMGAHFGSFILMYLRLVLEGYKVNVIMRKVRDVEFEAYIANFRDENGIQTIYSLPHRQCVVRCLRCLKDNEILVILLDQNYGDEGRVFVDFFGQPAATATGPVVFSQRSGAPLLPIFIQGNGENRHKIVIGSPVVLEAPAGDENSLIKNVSQLTKIIESKIRQYPYEWGGWMHRRWKTKQSSSELQ